MDVVLVPVDCLDFAAVQLGIELVALWREACKEFVYKHFSLSGVASEQMAAVTKLDLSATVAVDVFFELLESVGED